jgi:hypothetical protein
MALLNFVVPVADIVTVLHELAYNVDFGILIEAI